MSRLLAFLTPLLCAGAAVADDRPVPVPVALIGRLHFPLLHFPIALLFAAVLVEVALATKVEAQRRKEVSTLLLTVAALTAVVTAISGLAYAQGEDFSGPHLSTFQLHRNLGLLTAGVTVVLAAAVRADEGSTLRKLYKPALFAGALLVLFVGHEGGELVHGEGFLTRPLHKGAGDDQSGKASADDDVRLARPSDGDEGDGPEQRQRHPEGAIPEKPDYVRDIKPIFERSCTKCHGAEKRKSGLRLDVKRFAMKGGESGAAIVPGDPEKSLVFTSCAAAPDDEDVMPPKGKLLALSEIETIKRWIEQGAPWPD